MPPIDSKANPDHRAYKYWWLQNNIDPAADEAENDHESDTNDATNNTVSDDDR